MVILICVTVMHIIRAMTPSAHYMKTGSYTFTEKCYMSLIQLFLASNLGIISDFMNFRGPEDP